MPKKMFVSSFYLGDCEIKRSFREKVKDENRNHVLRKAISLMTQLLIQGHGKEEILSKIGELLCGEYRPSWFSYESMMQGQIDDDVGCFSRYLDYLLPCTIKQANCTATFTAGDTSLSCLVPLVFEKDGKLYAHIMFAKKADKSPGGRTVHSCSDNDLYAITAKGALEKEYPGIHVCLVYLFNSTDIYGSIGDFIVCGTKKSNLFEVSFKDCLCEDGLDVSALSMKAADILSHPVRSDCFGCDMKELCEGTSKKASHAMPRSVKPPESGYVMPSFTDTQKKIIDHAEGPLLVCACPGSGKTASLVGWIKARVDEGIPPEFILAVTFTRDAASEIAERCMSFCSADEMPLVTTLNAFCYRVLKENEDIVGKVKLLSEVEKIQLLDELLDGRSPLRGFSYAVKKGKNGLLKTVERRLEELSMNGQDQFMYEHPEIGTEFFEFSDEFHALVKSAGFISFDEQISLCLKLFRENPDILDAYQHMYKYVLVDEYQDVNKDQANLVYLLVKEHKNIIAIGDDDQSIYAFRGGSNKYMLQFSSVYEGAETIVLKENFRSTEALVMASRLVIQQNKERIDKEVVAVRKEGTGPVYLESTSPATVCEAVRQLIKEGYGYGDIAVLSSRNDTLEKLSLEADFPHVLGKSFLVNEPSIRVLSDILTLSIDGISDSVLLHYFLTFGEEVTGSAKEHFLSGSRASSFLKECMEDIEKGASALYITDKILVFFEQMDTAVDEAVGKLLEERRISSCTELKEILSFMCDYGDDTRLSPDTSSSVLLSTSHESKGLEWPCVIMIDDFKKDGTAESNRLYYVAMTRAKDRLYILRDNYKAPKSA